MTHFPAILAFAATLIGTAGAACREAADGVTKDGVTKDGVTKYLVCEFDPAKDDIRLFLNDAAGAPYGDFDRLVDAVEAKGQTLDFAMNAGMYHKDRSPVGLYVENREEKKKASTKEGPGNFHLLPNGVFWISDNKEGLVAAHVAETHEFLDSAHFIREATQSGPMLVIKGQLHPKFLADATSRKRRNGVGVREDGSVVFAQSDTAVTFHEFATYFRDALKTPDALYLDGTISRVYAPELSRNDPGLAMGPIVGVVGKNE